MAQQTVSRGTCVVAGHDSTKEFGTAGALENSSAIIALSDSGMAFFHVAGSDPDHKDNEAGMSGDFERFAINAKLFYVVFGSYAKNAPTYTTTTIEGYLNDLNGGATILWYKDGCYSRVVVNSQGEITLSVPLDGMHSTGYSGPSSMTNGGTEPVSLSYYLSASSSDQKATAMPGPAFSPEGEQPQSLFEMLEEGQDTAPAETSLVVIDKDETTLNDMQNLQDILLLKSFISVNAMSLMYKRRDNKPYNLDDKVEAAQFVIDQANALNEVTSKSMGGFLNPKKANAYSYEKSIIGAEVHSEILSFLFSSFSLPEKALAQIDGLLSTTNTTLSANIKNTHTTLNHMIYVFTFEPVEGLETVKLPVLRQLYLKVDQKSWEASIKAGKNKASVTKFSFKMNVVDSEWEMNPGQVDRQRTQIQDLLTNMTSANLDQINELASPSVIDTADTPTSSASFQITNGELRFHQGTTASQNLGGTSISVMMKDRLKKGIYDSLSSHSSTNTVKDLEGKNGIWNVIQSGHSEIDTRISYKPNSSASGKLVGLIQIVRAGSDDTWTTPDNNSERPRPLDKEQIKKTTSKGWRVDGHMTNTPFFNAAPYASNVVVNDSDKDKVGFNPEVAYTPTDRDGNNYLYDTTVDIYGNQDKTRHTYTHLKDTPSVRSYYYSTRYTLQFLVAAMDWTTGEVLDTLEWGIYGEKVNESNFASFVYKPRVVDATDPRDKVLLEQQTDCWKYWNENYEDNDPQYWNVQDTKTWIWYKQKEEIVKIPGQGLQWDQ